MKSYIQQVESLRGSLKIEYTVAKHGAEKLRKLLSTESCLTSLGCMSGGQAVQCAQAGLKSIYISGWQIAADNNLANETYPDQSLYPSNSVPSMVRRINKALQRADQIEFLENGAKIDYWLPMIADCEAGMGGVLNAFELAKATIESGAAALHFEDQLASEKRCGHLGGKVLVSIQQHIRTLKAARLAADVMDVPTVIIARTDALDAKLISNLESGIYDVGLTGKFAGNGLFNYNGSLEAAIDRCLAYAPYADMLWCETHEPSLEEARRFAKAIHDKFPDKWLAYNLSPSFNWKGKLSEDTISSFQDELAAMGYRWQFVTLAGFHSLNKAMFDLARDFKQRGMSAYADFQEDEGQLEGYNAYKHQRFVGAGYFDEISKVISGNDATSALKGSTEEKQF